MSSMEEIIEIFADAISSFIMLSITLQERNTAPAPALRPAAGTVVRTTETLVELASTKANVEYAEFPSIQADILDCVRLTKTAVGKISPALDKLYDGTGDRAPYWAALVNATQGIASQTSRLLLVVYGAEQRRLQAAGRELLSKMASLKGYGLMPAGDVAARAADLVHGTNAASKALMVFNSYVQVRATEIEGAKADLMARAVDRLNKLNQRLVDNCNALVTAISAETRKPFLLDIGTVEAITREILGIIKPPEELDIFQLVQSLNSQRAQTGAAAQRAALATPLSRAADALKGALKPLTEVAVDPATAKQHADAADGKAAEFLGLARAAVAEVDASADGDRRARMHGAVAEMDAERAVLKEATAAYVAEPNQHTLNKVNASARHFGELVDEFMEDARPLVTLVEPGSGTRLSTRPGDVEKTYREAKKVLESLRDKHADMDDVALHKAGAEATAKVAKFVEFIKAKQAREMDPAEAARLGDLARELQADNAAVVKGVNGFMANRSEEASAGLRTACQQTLDDLDRANNRIGAPATSGKTGPMTFDEEISEAAVDIQEAVDEYNLVPDAMKTLGGTLADLMEKLSEACRDGDRKAIIEITREMKGVVKEVRSMAMPLCKDISDPKLSDQVRMGAQAIGSFGTQLSILAAVKAGSLGAADSDPELEGQLVTCAEGIASSMRQTLFGIQTAKMTKKL